MHIICQGGGGCHSNCLVCNTIFPCRNSLSPSRLVAQEADIACRMCRATVVIAHEAGGSVRATRPFRVSGLRRACGSSIGLCPTIRLKSIRWSSKRKIRRSSQKAKRTKVGPPSYSVRRCQSAKNAYTACAICSADPAPCVARSLAAGSPVDSQIVWVIRAAHGFIVREQSLRPLSRHRPAEFPN